jgi:hypothetical protein
MYNKHWRNKLSSPLDGELYFARTTITRFSVTRSGKPLTGGKCNGQSATHDSIAHR